jgi:hypothetical protein
MQDDFTFEITEDVIDECLELSIEKILSLEEE